MLRHIRVTLRPKSNRTNQTKTGSVLAEAPAALWLLFVGILFPLLILATLSLRFGLFWEAAREAAQLSCQAQVFSPPSGGTLPSDVIPAVTEAQNTATRVLSMFPGSVNLIQPANVYIGVRQISSPFITWNAPNVPLPLNSVDTDANIYSIKVVLVGQVEPLIRMSVPYFGSIPGLTGPFVATVAEERLYENPNGLMQMQ